MQTVKYGGFEIIADIEKTKEYYSTLECRETQDVRNFRKYCENMAAEEKAFFESFGIDPAKIRLCGFCGGEGKNLIYLGWANLCGEYVKAEFTPNVTSEHLQVDEELMKSYRNMGFKVGNFDIDFDSPEDFDDTVPEGFISLHFMNTKIPWLLEEKPEKDLIIPESPKEWELHKRIFNAIKSKKDKIRSVRVMTKHFERELTRCGVEFRRMGKLEYKGYRNEWVKRFRPSFADEKKVRVACLEKNASLGNLFSHGYAHALDRRTARSELNATKKCKSILICNGEKRGYVLLHTYKLSAETLESFGNITLTSANFAWTYCQTPESGTGPYFYRPKKK